MSGLDIVIDANITVALFVRLAYSEQAEALFRSWRTGAIQLHAPALWPPEVASALQKMVSVGQLTIDDSRLSIAAWSRLPVQVTIPDAELMDTSLAWAAKIGQVVAYDAQYLALAERLQAEFWTADRRLYAATQNIKIPWVHWVGEPGNNIG